MLFYRYYAFIIIQLFCSHFTLAGINSVRMPLLCNFYLFTEPTLLCALLYDYPDTTIYRSLRNVILYIVIYWNSKLLLTTDRPTRSKQAPLHATSSCSTLKCSARSIFWRTPPRSVHLFLCWLLCLSPHPNRGSSQHELN